MIVIKNIEELNNYLIESAEINITVGNFDGVHLGHKDFLSSIKKESVDQGRKFLVMTFVPHPAFVLKAKPHFLINTYGERRQLLENEGVDYLVEVDFTRDFSTMSPEEFLERFIFKNKMIKKIFLGYDFHFGANKAGNFILAKTAAVAKGVELVLHNEFKVQSNSVSSTLIRSKIELGLVDDVCSLLGRNYFLTGRIIKGQGRGKQIGFPTANIGYDTNVIIPAKGVYITHTSLSGMLYESVTNVGVNPTFSPIDQIHIETHLLGFSRDIYGEEIKVEFLKKIRDEKKFPSVNELVKQIDLDVSFAKEFFLNE